VREQERAALEKLRKSIADKKAELVCVPFLRNLLLFLTIRACL
jgi:hypothetical protein